MLQVLVLAKPSAENQGLFMYDDEEVLAEKFQLKYPTSFELIEIWIFNILPICLNGNQTCFGFL